ncbi:hypothetical protein CEXT_640131 [Caerostris extrusa]|uniref:Uncharacterized protein n=1 Tax=Caerostris extrusa TaxID=172846 RepID=A0AAV4NIB0_CAEEX|nr:hypothetical protein CEXT_640131 [Caerostris extrusa]
MEVTLQPKCFSIACRMGQTLEKIATEAFSGAEPRSNYHTYPFVSKNRNRNTRQNESRAERIEEEKKSNHLVQTSRKTLKKLKTQNFSSQYKMKNKNLQRWQAKKLHTAYTIQPLYATERHLLCSNVRYDGSKGTCTYRTVKTREEGNHSERVR